MSLRKWHLPSAGGFCAALTATRLFGFISALFPPPLELDAAAGDTAAAVAGLYAFGGIQTQCPVVGCDLKTVFAPAPELTVLESLQQQSVAMTWNMPEKRVSTDATEISAVPKQENRMKGRW